MPKPGYVELIDPDGNTGLVREEHAATYLTEGGRGRIGVKGDREEVDPAWSRPKEATK